MKIILRVTFRLRVTLVVTSDLQVKGFLNDI